jgi:hypothetical protein
MRFLAGVILVLTFLVGPRAMAYPMNSSFGHFYFGFGPNFNLRGNIRLGVNSLELGLIQEAGFGAMYVLRTDTAFFYQIGGILSNGGAIIGGGGMEWNTSSFFRFRTDITVKTTSSFETEGYVSVGGVFIL